MDPQVTDYQVEWVVGEYPAEVRGEDAVPIGFYASIVWGNGSESGDTMSDFSSDAPLFVDAENGDFPLQANSPLISEDGELGAYNGIV